MNVLYVTWDGPQTTYLEGLFLPIFARLARRGIAFHVIQLTWGPRERIGARAAACRAAGVSYRAIAIARRAGIAGQAAAVIAGARAVRACIRDAAIDVLMPRGPFAGAVVLAARRGERLLYEADGLTIDERVEFGALREGGVVHRLLRRIEATLARSADRVLCRTAFGRSVILYRAGPALSADRVGVVGNGRDPDVYAPMGDHGRTSVRARSGIAADAPLVVYVGSLGPQYCLPEMAAFFASVAARRPDARLLVVTHDASGGEALRRQCGRDAGRVVVTAAPAAEVPAYLAAADLGLSFRAQTMSMRAVAPIKIGEYLLCGVPALVNGAEGAAAIHPVELTRDGLTAAADWFVGDVLAAREGWRKRARAQGVAEYGLDQTVARYASVLASFARPPLSRAASDIDAREQGRA